MKTELRTKKSKLNFKLITLLLSFTPLLLTFGSAHAANLYARKVELGSSRARTGVGDTTTTTHKFYFTIPTAGNGGSIKFQYCTTPSGECSAPTNIDVDGVGINSQSGVTGFSLDATGTDADTILLTRSPASVTADTAAIYNFTGAKNPTSAATFYVRITTYTGADGITGPTDSGAVAASTANQIALSAQLDPTLNFCLYTGANCGAGGNIVNLGTLSVSTPKTGTHKIDASTNSSSGYTITYTGTTLTSGPNTIAAINPASGSTINTSQFGFNLVANTSPTVGAAPSGTGTATVSAGYSSANNFKFNSTDQVASAGGPSSNNTFTISWLGNTSGTQAPGSYTTTITFICTATL